MINSDAVKMVIHGGDSNKIPVKSSCGDVQNLQCDMIHNTSIDEDASQEQMTTDILLWMKRITITLICFIGIALIIYLVINLCVNDWSKDSTPLNATTTTMASPNIFERVPHIFKSTNDEGSTTQNMSFFKKNSGSDEAQLSMLEKGIITLYDQPPSLESNFSSKLDRYVNAAVCSDKVVCSEIGRALMQEGGSAVDAAISTLLCNGIVSQQSMGIGGGMFMNIYIKEENKAYTIDAREVAPFAADPHMFDDSKDASLNEGLAIAVPGELEGYYRAHQRFGKLPWEQLIEPSIKICEDGFYMTQHVRLALLDRMELLKNNNLIKNIYFNATTGEMHPLGYKLKTQKELCQTYKSIAANGPSDFYNGTLAKLVVADLRDLGSVVNSYDLESYNADLVNSIAVPLGDYILYSPPPVSSGIVVASILSILQGYNFTASDLRDPENIALTIHRITEAMKFGYAKRWELGDMRFNDVRELISKLTSPDNAAFLRKKIKDSFVLGNSTAYDAHFMGTEDYGTSHTVVLAPNGDAVSVTSSINHYFGSSQIGARTGIVFNSGMNDFSISGQSNLFNLPPAQSNLIAPRKRPMSSMAPLILTSQNGNVHMVIGSAGGSKIIAAVVQVIARVLWFQNSIKEAIDAPRFYHQLVPNKLEYDAGGLSNEVIKILQSKGHTMNSFNEIGTVVCGIVKNGTAIYANADFRKRGGTAGY